MTDIPAVDMEHSGPPEHRISADSRSVGGVWDSMGGQPAVMTLTEWRCRPSRGSLMCTSHCFKCRKKVVVVSSDPGTRTIFFITHVNFLWANRIWRCQKTRKDSANPELPSLSVLPYSPLSWNQNVIRMCTYEKVKMKPVALVLCRIFTVLIRIKYICMNYFCNGDCKLNALIFTC